MYLCRLRALIIVVLLATSAIIIDTTLNYTVEQAAREQARTILSKVKSCVSHSMQPDIRDRLSECGDGVQTTPTGDIFAYDLTTKKFMYDPSLDCHIDGGKRMTPDSICAIHADPGKCETALRTMNQGYNSTSATRASWLFDDATEYLEWVILPDETTGFNGLKRNGNTRPEQILVAIGIQSDELNNQYAILHIMLRVLTLLGIVLTLVFDNITRGKYDCRTPSI